MDGCIFFSLQTRRSEKLRGQRSEVRSEKLGGQRSEVPLQLLQTDSESSFRHVGAVDLPLQDSRVVSVLVLIGPVQAKPLT